jgi:cell division septal protein FtsQ
MLVLCLAALLFGLAILLFSPVTLVREIRIVRDDPRLDIRAVLAHLHPFYKERIFFLASSEIASVVRQAVPDAKNVDVSKDYPSTIRIRIELLPVAARLQIQEPTTQETTATGSLTRLSQETEGGPVLYDFLTANGLYVVSPNQHRDDPLPTIRVVDWGVRPLPGTPIAKTEILDRMNKAEQVLVRELGQQIKSRTIFLRAQEFHLQTPRIEYWFDMRSTLEEQLRKLRSFLQTVQIGSVKSYIDLRVEGRVVYK